MTDHAPASQPPSRRSRALARIAETLYPGATPSGPASALETRALLAAAWSAGAAVLVSLLVFWGGDVPLWGARSPGVLAAVTGATAGTVACVVAYLHTTREVSAHWTRGFSLAKRALDAAAIALVHFAIIVLLVLLVFYILSEGFLGLRVDTFTAVMIVSAVTAACAYATTLSASSITASTLSVLLTVFLTAGILVAMLTTTETDWWRLHFSELGVGDSVSVWVFTLTLAGGGLLMTTLAFYLARDLDVWAAQAPPSRTRNVNLVQWCFVLVGVCLIGVALIPVNVSLLVHNTFATGMAVLFGALLIGLRWLLDGFTRSFLVLSDAVAIGIAAAALLFWPIQYYNLAAFELIAVLLIFAWLIIFIRHVGALTGTPQLPPAARVARQPR